MIGYEVVSSAGDYAFDMLDIVAIVMFTLLSTLIYFRILKPKCGTPLEVDSNDK